MRRLFDRFVALFRRDRIVSDIDSELRHHRDLLAERLEREGLSREDATREAQRRLGNIAVLRDAGFDVRGGGAMERLLHDLRDAARMIRRRPAFTLSAVAILSLGIGANTTMFSVAHAVLLEPLPYHDSERLVVIWNQYGASQTSNSAPDL